MSEDTPDGGPRPAGRPTDAPRPANGAFPPLVSCRATCPPDLVSDRRVFGTSGLFKPPALTFEVLKAAPVIGRPPNYPNSFTPDLPRTGASHLSPLTFGVRDIRHTTPCITSLPHSWQPCFPPLSSAIRLDHATRVKTSLNRQNASNPHSTN